ncbi:MAG: hypothetical protein IJE49_03180 [Agathobacter sp.]|nr:hypothetical protein [Agathobacter sp.]
MADIKKKGFKTLETEYEDLDERIREHRKSILKRVLQVIAIVAVVIIGIEFAHALRHFDDYEVRNSLDRGSSGVTQYETFGTSLLEYSNDGISCIARNDDIIWNQSFEMADPEVQICGEYLVIYDAAGTKLFIMTESGLQKSLEMTAPIQTVCIAEQGTIAVLMKENQESQVKLFDKKGNELANGKFYGDKGGFPIDIALSYDGTKLAVDMVDVTKGKVNTTISFYNFGSVGQSEIDNNVGTYTFEGLLVPEINYVSNSRMVGLGTGKVLVFDGTQKPELSREIEIEEEVLSFFYNEKYVGIVSDNIEVENSWHIKVMDVRGKTVMQNDTSIPYNSIEFLSNNEICVMNTTQCEIFTIHSIKKFAYEFDKELNKILATDDGQNYTFIFKDTIEEVKLK